MPPPHLRPALAEILEGLRGDRNEFADYDQDGKDLKAGAMGYDAIEFEARTILDNLDNADRENKVIDEKEVMGHDQTGEASGGGPKGSDTSASNSNAAMIESIQKLRRSLESPDTIPRFPCEEVGCTKRYHDWLLLQMHVREMHGKPPILPAIPDGNPPAVPAIPDAPLSAPDTKDTVPSSWGSDNAGFGSSREWTSTAKDIAPTNSDPKSEYRTASFNSISKERDHGAAPDEEDRTIQGQRYQQTSASDNSRLYAGDHYGTTQPSESESILEQDGTLDDQSKDPRAPVLRPSPSAGLLGTRPMLAGAQAQEFGPVRPFFFSSNQQDQKPLSLLDRRFGAASAVETLPSLSQASQLAFQRSMHSQANLSQSSPLAHMGYQAHMKYHDASDKKLPPPLPARSAKLISPSAVKTLPPMPQLPSRRPNPLKPANTHLQASTLESGSLTQKRHPDIKHKKSLPPPLVRLSKQLSGPSFAGLDTPSFAGFSYTLFLPNHPGEAAFWIPTPNGQVRGSEEDLFDKALSYTYKRKPDWSCAEESQALSLEQQTLINVLLKGKNADEEEPNVEWTLLGVKKLYELRHRVFGTRKFNYDICVTIKRADKVILAENIEDENANKRASSDEVFKFLVTTRHERKILDSKGTKNPGVTELTVAQPASSPDDTNGNSRARTSLRPSSKLPRPQSGDASHHPYGVSSAMKAFLDRERGYEVRLEILKATLRDADTEASGSHAWLTSSAGEVGVTEQEEESKARTSPHHASIPVSISDSSTCEACDVRFGTERAHKIHLRSNKHRNNVGLPLQAYLCPNCHTLYSRWSEVRRHLDNDKCSGPESLLIAETTHDLKHRLAVASTELRSTQIEATLEEKQPIHVDVVITDFPVASTVPEKDATEEGSNTEILDRGDVARELAQDLELLDDNSKETTQEQSTLKLQLQEEEDQVAVESETVPQHDQDIDDMLQIAGALDQDFSTPTERLGLSHDVYDKSSNMPPRRAEEVPHQDFDKDNFLDSLSSVQSTQDDFWSNPDSCGDRPYRRGTPGTSPERGYLHRPADKHRLPYLYEERHGRRDSRPDLLRDRDPQRSVSILEDLTEYAFKVEQVSHTNQPQPSKLIDDITKSLFCTRELEPILNAACKDVDIGAERLEQDLRRLIQLFGEELKSEATDARELDAARAMMKLEVSSYVAWVILQHVTGPPSKSHRVGSLQFDLSKVGLGAERRNTLQNTRGLLRLATTNFRTFEEEVIRSNRNEDLNLKEIQLIVNAVALQESEMALQLKQLKLLTFLTMVFLPLSFISSFFGMNLHAIVVTQHKYWWYTSVLILIALCMLLVLHSSHRLRGYHRIELPPTSNNGTHTLLYNSEAYDIFRAELLDYAHEPYEKRVLSAIGDEVEQSGVRLEQDGIHCLAREVSWVPIQSLTFASDTSLSRANAVKALVEDRLGESWNWWPLAPRMHRLRSGHCRMQWKSPCGTLRHVDLPENAMNALQQAVLTAPVFINIGIPSKTRAHSSCGHGVANLCNSGSPSAGPRLGPGNATPSTTLTGLSAHPQQVSKPAPVASPHSNTSAQNVQPQHINQHLSLCIVSSSRNFVSLRCDALRSDLEFFAKMKADYDRKRGRLRLWLSMWRYKYSEFVLFHKYGYHRGARVDVGFPDDNDQMYHFLPRKPTPPPPSGPISKEQFNDHYYLDHCPCLYDWKRYQLSYRGHFNKANRVALDAVPKRLVRINMDDGVDEHFYGLYAKEERSFLRVAIYAFLCNLPGVIFFFLWLFQWQHASDLQNASVPLTLSLSLTLGFAAVIFGTRDGD